MRPIPSLLATLAVAALAPIPAGAATVKADYGIWLGGFSLGQAGLATTIDGSRYKMQLQVKLTGLAGLLTGGRGAATSSGSLGSGQPMPASFAISSEASGGRRTVRIGLSGGSVQALDVNPPLVDKEDRVPVREAHKRGILDPVSSLLMPASARGDLMDSANCNRTLPVFDGGARFDVVLTYAETKQVEKPGYKGPVLVCNARYVPVAGHRPDRPGTKFMEGNRDMNVWLAPVEGTRVLLPLRIEVMTANGRSLIEASRWSFEGGAKVVPASVPASETTSAID